MITAITTITKKSIYLFVLLLFLTLSANLTAQSKVEIKKNAANQTMIGITENNFNVFIGNASGINSTVNAFNNIGLGDAVLNKNTDGSGNIAIGSSVLFENITGANNIGMGLNALKNNASGMGNVAIGNASMTFSVSGNNNTFLGNEAGYFNNGGNTNVGIGHGSLYNNVTGSGNVAIGNDAGRNASGDNGVFIGQEAGKNTGGSNQLFIENSDLDSTEALIYGEFDNNKLRFNAETSIYSNSSAENGIYVEKTHTGFVDIPAIYGVNKVNDYYGIGVRGEGGYIGVFGSTVGTGTGFYSGVAGSSTSINMGTNVGIRGFASGASLNYGVYGAGNGTANTFAGYFNGQLKVRQFTNEQTYFEIENEVGESVLVINDDDVVEVNRLKTNWYTEMDSLKTNWYTSLTNVTATGNTSLTNVTTNGSTNLEIESGKRINKATSMKYYIATEGAFPSTSGPIADATLISEIKLFPAMVNQPAGWLPCEGQVLNIIDYTTLYSLIGTSYGGDGNTTFALPDMRNAVPHQN
jgi:microcystin-dependent protein